MLIDELLDHWPRSGMGEVDPPAISIDGHIVPLADLGDSVSGRVACIFGIKTPQEFEQICDALRVESLYVRDLKVADISAVTALSDLKRLAMYFAPKLADIGPLVALRGLEMLALWEAPALHDLDPLGHMDGLRSLQVSGGLTKPARIRTLNPVGNLAGLAELRMHNIKVDEGGLRPISGCKALKELSVSNQFPTEDYAYLSVHLPNTACDLFAPYTPLDSPLADGRDVMVTGARKPFLSSAADVERLERYASEYAELQDRFRV